MSYVLGIVLCVVLVVALCILDCGDLKEIFDENKNTPGNDMSDEDFIKVCQTMKGSKKESLKLKL